MYKLANHYRIIVCLIAVMISTLSSQLSIAEPTSPALPLTKIILPPIEKSSEKSGSFFPRVLDLALSKTVDTYGPYQIVSYPFQLTNARFISELERKNAVNLMWTMSNKEREEKLRPIKISLLKELNSYRIFLINKKDQPKFDKIQTIEELRELRAGQGTTWPDTQVFRANKIPVVTSAHYELLFAMLEANRFDYFPRGLYEIWDEYEIHKEHQVAIEENLMFYYDGPIYFFTNKEDEGLAERVETGLKIAIADGSFDKLFYSYKGFKKGEEELNKHNRRLFELE